MISQKFYFPSTAKCKINLYVLSDLHIGSVAFLKDEFKRISERIKADPNAYTLFLGDLTDDDRPSTRDMRTKMFADRKEAYYKEDDDHRGSIEKNVIPELKKLISPRKCLGMLDGDHYRQYRNGLTSVQFICAKMDIPYLGDGMAKIKLVFINKNRSEIAFNIHAHHGVGGTGRSGAAVNKLEDVAHGWEGVDCFVRGHNHKGFIQPYPRYYDDRKGFTQVKDIWLINSPSFRTGIVDGFTDYAEHRAYSPSTRKFPVLHLSITKSRESNGNPKVVSSGELI